MIGAVHGVALGTGLALAASCDFVVATEDARFGLPELTVGVMGELATSRASRTSLWSAVCISPETPCRPPSSLLLEPL